MAGWGWVVVVVAGGGWWCGWVQAGFRLGAAGCKGKVIGFDYDYYDYSYNNNYYYSYYYNKLGSMLVDDIRW